MPRRRYRPVGLAVITALLALPALALALAAAPSSAASAPRSTAPASAYRGFSDPQAVTIEGYSATAMEPFITRDGQDLFFNTSNQSPDIASLEYATRVSNQSFVYQGPIAGANDPSALSATPSMDDDGDLYFVSPRSYPQTLSTVYTGQFSAGQVTAVHLVPGVSGGTAGMVDFDVEVSADGDTLYVSVGHFAGGPDPQSAQLVLFDKHGSTFVADPHGPRLLHAVNKKGILTYAASISTDGLELFFTRAQPTTGRPAIYRAVRTSTVKPFGHVQRIAAITGFAEAPSISADGTTLYYHLLVGSQFDIETVARPPT
jgi:hypothetical protein